MIKKYTFEMFEMNSVSNVNIKCCFFVTDLKLFKAY